MKNQQVAVTVVLVALLGVFWYLLPQRDTFSELDWVTRYSESSQRLPYNLDIFSALLQDIEDMEVVRWDKQNTRTLAQLPQNDAEGHIYIFMDAWGHHDEEAYSHLYHFLEAGGQVLWAVESFPNDLWETFAEKNEQLRVYRQMSYRVTTDSVITLQIDDQKTTLTHSAGIEGEAEATDWSYLRAPWDFLPEAKVLGVLTSQYVREQANFFEIKIGKGYLRICTTPLIFTNYYIRQRTHFDFVQQVLAHFEGTTLYWDRINTELAESPDEEPTTLRKTGPLDYILRQEALRWSWYLLLLGGVLYMIFRAKREQRVIPVLLPNRNTSLAFVKSIGRLYFLQGAYQAVFKQQMQLFLAQVRQRYQISTNGEDAFVIEQIAKRSQVAQSTIEELFTYYNQHQASQQIRAKEVVHLYTLLKAIYNQAK